MGTIPNPGEDMNWMEWTAPNDIERREVDGKKQIRTPLHDWYEKDDPGKFWEYIGYCQGLREAKRQERAARLHRLLRKAVTP